MQNITILSVQNPIRLSNNVINCLVTFSHMPNTPILTSATSYDNTEHGIKLWNDLNEGVYGQIQNPVELTVTTKEIDVYRDEMIEKGIIFKEKLIQTRPQDRENMAGASTLATLAIINGAQPENYYWHGANTPFTWICADNTTIELDAFEMLNLGKALATYKQQCIFAARILKNTIENGTNVPNYKEESNWPSNKF